MLMALVGANRSSELAALDLRFRTFSPEGVTFRLATLTKKRNPGTPPRELFFGSFPADPDLCVQACLKEYEKRTQPFRRITMKQETDKLFLSYVKPYKPVSSQRLAHWLKAVMEEAGVDISVYSAHSIRGASATSAEKQGVSMNDILKMADWSTESTFRRFYYRPTKTTSFAEAVLSGGSGHQTN